MTKVQFEHWYRNNVRLMYYVAYERLQNREQVEDAVSEAVFRMYSALQKWDCDEERDFRKLAVIVTRNAAIDIFRKNTRTMPMSPEKLADFGGVSEDVLKQTMAKIEMEQVRAAMEELNEEDRIVLFLRGVHGLSEKETAKLLGIKPKSVGVRLCRARKRLMQMIEGKAGD